ncbi:hypothetical protein H9P43_007286 [Blastocladiella emersonii ATCC 22665]|nr:hypothetical protein H9P43_007286 [Blastocladiella emersonii ATCC 22665]
MKTRFWLDFDSTLTIDDTIAHLAALPYLKNPSLHPPFNQFVDRYLADYAACKSGRPLSPDPALSINDSDPRLAVTCPTPFPPGTPRALALAAAADAIAQVQPAEIRSIERISRAGIFFDLTPADLSEHGAAIPLRPGAAAALRKWKDRGDAITVCSVNWSAGMICGALAAAAGAGGVSVFSSNLTLEVECGVTTGEIDASVVNGVDKLKLMLEWMPLGEGRGRVVCVGDSLNDLPCMLAADVAIFVAPEFKLSGSVTSILDEAGIALVRLPLAAPIAEADEAADEAAPRIFVAESWDDISAFLDSVETR